MLSNLSKVLFIAGISLINCEYYAPRCEFCKYTPGHSYMRHKHCDTYITCSWGKPDSGVFVHDLICCDPPMVFDDEQHPPGCYFESSRTDCKSARFYACPDVEDSSCPFKSHDNNKQKFLIRHNRQWQEFECGNGTEYLPDICGCGFPPPDQDSCPLLLHFDFDLNIQSTACDLWVNAEIVGDVFMAGGVICFNGTNQMLMIDHLMNWFAKKRYEFTVSFWFMHEGGNYAGLFSTNCLWRSQGSPVEIMIINGELSVVLGNQIRWSSTGAAINTTQWYHTAVTYYMGKYEVFLDGKKVYTEVTEGPFVRTFTHASLAYVERDMFFTGCMDDFKFYTSRLTEEQLYEYYANKTQV